MAHVDNLRTFVRVYELGSMSAAARDQRLSPAVASARISQLEAHLNVRLFLRTTRSLTATEQGNVLYPKALRALEALSEAEAAVHEVTGRPRGSIFVAAPLGVGKRLIAPAIPRFHESYPDVHVRLRLSDRKIDLTAEGVDVAFHLGEMPDSDMRVRNIADCPRVICAAPAYIARRGHPDDGTALVRDRHDCLLLRFPGSTEFRWTLVTADGPVRFDVAGPFESDDGDVLTAWAREGHGIVNKPLFDVAGDLLSGALVRVCEGTPPPDTQLVCLYPPKRNLDAKVRLFMEFMARAIRARLRDHVG